MPDNITIGVLALQGAFIEHIHYLQRLRPKGHTIHAIPVRSLPELSQCNALVIPGGESTVIASVASHTPGLLEALQAFVKDPERPVWGTCAGMILMAEEEGIGGGKKAQKGWGGIDGLKVWRNLYGTQLESFEAPLTIPQLSDPSTPFNAIFIRAPAVHSLTLRSSSPNDETTSLPGCTPTQNPSSTPSTSSSTPRKPVRKSSATHAFAPSTSSPLATYVDTLPTPESSRSPSPSPSLDDSSDLPTATVETVATLPVEFHPPPPPSDSHLGEPRIADLGKVMIRQGKKMVTSFHPELSGDARIHEYWVEKCVLGN